LPERPDAGELLDVARESLLALVADTDRPTRRASDKSKAKPAAAARHAHRAR
jgi:hypothetical protein